MQEDNVNKWRKERERERSEEKSFYNCKSLISRKLKENFEQHKFNVLNPLNNRLLVESAINVGPLGTRLNQ